MSARRLRRPAAALAAAFMALLVAGGPQAATARTVQSLHLEPGQRLPDGRLLVPLTKLDEDGQTLAPPSRDELSARVDGEPAAILDLAPDVATTVLVVSDQFLVAAAWDAATILAPGSPHWLGVWDASADPIRVRPLQPAGGRPAPPALPAPHVPRIWDAILAGLRELATLDGAPERRVLLVIGDLREEQDSVHPMAACLEAARELTIPVHGVVLDWAEAAAVERLRHLAEASGGSLAGASSALPAVAGGLARVLAARGLVLADPGGSGPVAITVSAAGAASATTTVAARPRGRYTPGMGLVAAGAIMLAAAGGVLGWRQWRRRAVGYLVSVDPATPLCRPIPACGLTIGRTAENGLTLAEKGVSKHHALVRWRRGQVQLIDLRSTNGTQVGGRPVRTAALGDGDVIVFGDAVAVQFRRRAPLPRDRA